MNRDATYCCDANVALRLFDEMSPERPAAIALWEKWSAERALVLAPPLFGFEVANGLHRAVLAGKITANRSAEVMLSVSALPVAYVDMDSRLHLEAMRLANEFDMKAAYDAHYLAVAKMRNVSLYTLDRKLFNTVGDKLQNVRYILNE